MMVLWRLLLLWTTDHVCPVLVRKQSSRVHMYQPYLTGLVLSLLCIKSKSYDKSYFTSGTQQPELMLLL